MIKSLLRLLGLSVAMAASAASAAPLKLVARIPVPGAPLKSFDIGFAANGTYALADRSNASVDLFDVEGRRFIGRVGGFAGAHRGGTGGPNGALMVDGKQLWAGDGDSKVRIVDIRHRHIIAAISTGGVKRVDELAYDPQDQLVMAANNDDAPPFVTLISTRPPYAVRARIALPRASAGLEQPVWDPATARFYLAIPELDGVKGRGGVAVIDPRDGQVVGVDQVDACMPAGLAVGPENDLLVGCSDDAIAAGFPAHSVLLDARSGQVLRSFDEVGGSDEIWYDARTGLYGLAAVADPRGAALGLIDAHARKWIANLPSGHSAHSVAADGGTFFVPIAAGDEACPRGCIAIYRK